MITVTATVLPATNAELKKLCDYHQITRTDLINIAIGHFLEKAGDEQTRILEEWKIKNKKGQLIAEKAKLEQRLREIDKEINKS